MKIETVVDCESWIGEGPLWHPGEKKLYWIDILDGSVFRYDPTTRENEQVYSAGESIGGFTIQEDGSLLLFGHKGAIRRLKDGKTNTLIEEVPDLATTRFNDVIADPEGRVFCGSVPDSDGKHAYLFRLDVDGTLTKMLDNVGLSNGMGFTLDKKHMYHVDSTNFVVSIYDYEQRDGTINNGRTFLQLNKSEIEPDGLTVDSEGFVWLAFWNGGCVRRFTPNGQEVLKIDFPVKKPTSLIFAGDDYSEVYVTSAGGENRSENGEFAGSLFRMIPGIRGVAEYRSKIRF